MCPPFSAGGRRCDRPAGRHCGPLNCAWAATTPRRVLHRAMANRVRGDPRVADLRRVRDGDTGVEENRRARVPRGDEISTCLGSIAMESARTAVSPCHQSRCRCQIASPDAPVVIERVGTDVGRLILFERRGSFVSSLPLRRAAAQRGLHWRRWPSSAVTSSATSMAARVDRDRSSLTRGSPRAFRHQVGRSEAFIGS